MILHQGYMKKKDIPRIGLVKGEIEKQVSSFFFFLLQRVILIILCAIKLEKDNIYIILLLGIKKSLYYIKKSGVDQFPLS